MLELFTIFTSGGIILWEKREGSIDTHSSVNSLIRDVVAEARGGEQSYALDAYGVQYVVDNKNKLVFVAVYNKNLVHQLGYVKFLLPLVQVRFAKRYADKLNDPLGHTFQFDDDFVALLAKAEEKAKDEENNRQMQTFDETKKAQNLARNLIKDSGKSTKDKPQKTTIKETEESEGSDSVGEENNDGQGIVEQDQDQSSGKRENDLTERGKKRLEELKRAKDKKGKTPPRKQPQSQPKSSKEPAPSSKPMRMDYSDGPASDDQVQEEMRQMMEGVSIESGDMEELDTPAVEPTTTSSGFFSYFKTLTQGSTITEEALKPVLENMKTHLISKNVASDVASQLCHAVSEALVGKKQGSFQALSKLVKDQLEIALTQILTPKRRVDILRDIYRSKEKRKPFTMVFCGVNGVGKSTNLAKIAFWLLKNNFRVLIAACDTFRAGAVEQLKTHCRKLDAIFKKEDAPPSIQLYDKGYGKDDAGVAREAIHFAEDSGFDVVLIDTAGRMQDNSKLMRSLAKLIRENVPDLVLFVGEALVGHEAVDQLSKFNQALIDLADPTNVRSIDGILLTKFDTVDDKVGSTISMAYTTGQPIVFVGTGQTYTDIKKLNVEYVVSCLLKS